MENGNVLTEDLQDPVYFQIGYLNQIPHPKQIEVLKSSKKNKLIVCGRRSGKTQMIAGEIIRGAILGEYPRQIVIAPQYKQAIIVFNKIIQLMQNAEVMHDIVKINQSPSPEIFFKNGYVYFASADNPNSLRGEAWDRVFKDESAFIKKGSDNALKPLTYDKGAPIWETTTPWGKGDVWERWQRGMRGDDKNLGCFHYNYKDNIYLAKEGIEEIEKDIEEYGENSLYVQAEIYGNFVEDVDVFFKRELIESCIEDYKLDTEINPKAIHSLGVDFARMGEDETISISIENYKDILRIVNIISTKHKLLTDAIGRIKILNEKYKYDRICLDETGLGSGPTDLLTESFGYKVQGIYFTVKSKMEMYSHLKKLMEQGKLKIPNDKKLIFQLMDLRYEVMSNGNLKLHHSEKGHDDYPDALALACWATKDNENDWKPTIIGR